MAVFKPKNITVTLTGDVSKETFRGDFLVKTMLSHNDQFLVARKKRELLGDNKISDLPLVLQQKSLIISELSARVLQAPSWWGSDGSELIDNNVLVAVFEAAIEAEDEVMKKLQGDGQEAKRDLEKIVENASRTEVVVPEKR